jgi:hypothetical protein
VRRKAAIPFDLHYLLTVWSKNAPTQQHAPGWAVRWRQRVGRAADVEISWKRSRRSACRDTSRYELRLFERKLGKISPASPLDAVRQVGVGPA